METTWEKLLEFLRTASADMALKIAGTLVLLFVGFKAIKLVTRMLDKAMAKSKLDLGVQSFFENAVSILLRFILVISVLMYLGVPAASFIAILSSAGLAIGLAMQGSLSNFAGGVMILLFRPFRVGDFIKTDNAEGNVQNISIMYTTLKTLDGRKVVIPNAMLSNGVITDVTWHETRRIDITINTDFAASVPLIKGILQGAAQDNPQVLAEPAPAASLDDIQNGLLVFTLRCWAKTPEWWATKLALTAEIKQRLDSHEVQVRGSLVEVRNL